MLKNKEHFVRAIKSLSQINPDNTELYFQFLGNSEGRYAVVS